MTKCPHCAYENWPWATHCAGCLKDLNPAPTPTRQAAPPEEPAAVPKSLRPTIPSPAGWLGAAVAVVLGVVLLAQFGQWLSRQEPPPAQARTDTPVQPVSPPAPVTTTPAPEAAPVTPPPVAEEEDRAPEIQYKVAMSWLERKKPDRARKAFEEVLVKYPSSRFAQEAQVQLDQLHAPKTAASREPFSSVVDEDPVPQLQYRVAMNWVTRNNPAKAKQAFEELLRKYPTSRYASDARAQLARLPVSEPPAAKAPAVEARAETTPPSPPGTLTNEDIRRLAAAARTGSGESPAKQPVLPALGDSLTLVSSETSGGQMILRLRYRLAIGRTRSVHAAVRVVFPEPHPPVFVYSPETVQGGAGETMVRVPLAQQLISIKPIGARLMLFESNGPMFYSHDVPWTQ